MILLLVAYNTAYHAFWVISMKISLILTVQTFHSII